MESGLCMKLMRLWSVIPKKNILKIIMLPFAKDEMPTEWIFQHDNAPKHASKYVKSWIQVQIINMLKSPAQSIDLNPTENLWHMVDNNKKIKLEQESNKRNFFFSPNKSSRRESISKSEIQKLISSMPRKYAAVLRNKGYFINY